MIPTKISFLVLTFFIVVNAGAQDIKKTKLDWTVTGLLDLDTKESANYSCSFTTNGTNDILWKQGGGKLIRTLHVISIDGDWKDIQIEGFVTYYIDEDGEKGTLIFKRSASGTTIVLDLSQSTYARLKQQFSVSRIAKSN